MAAEAARLQRHAEAKASAAAATATLLGAVGAGLLLCIYVATSFAGAAMHLSRSLVAFLFAALGGVALLSGNELGWETLLGSVKQSVSPLTALCMQLVDEDLLRATSVFGAPLFLAYLLLATLNQAIRRARAALGGRPPLAADEASLPLTRLAHRQLAALAGWPWASVLLKVYTLGLLGWLLLYGSTLTYMGLSLMISWLQTVHWLTASAFFFLFGIVLFLLPPVPGTAVYLCAGVLLTPACQEAFGYWGACVYSAFLAVGVKNVALVMQMKLLGEVLGADVRVRAAVGVNSGTIKAIRLILQEPGLTLAKVCILCAGPDWPTGVLCGILRLEVRQMLIGLTPLFVLTVPSSLASAFQLRISEGGSWEPLASLMLMAAALTQLAASVVALYYIERVQQTAAAACPDDPEVLAIENEQAEAHAAFVRATAFGLMPRGPKAVLISGVVVLVLSVYLLVLASSSCFEEFALADDVASALCFSCERAPIKPLGWAALAMLSYSIACLVSFYQWVNSRLADDAKLMV